MEDLWKVTQERFHDKVDIREDGCWLWTGAVKNKHRASGIRGNMLNAATGKVEDAARISMQMYRPRVKIEGKQVVVTCGERLCVNPEHLKVVDALGFSKGSGHPNSKLDEITVKKVRRIYEYNRNRPSLQSLAEQYGVSRETIRKIAMGYDSQLPAEQINEIRRTYKPYISPKSVLPEGVDITEKALERAAAGESWQHVE
jgi:DNA-binding Xre family transcriptional regulator